ncbi:MAG: glycosyltransferase family 2 protein [Deltaproteobacteria bacterium]|nr:glycosyltransferase family 2 protein [Deltaproteobacteria bacterium]
MISASIVAYNTNPDMLSKAIASVLQNKQVVLYLVDNSPSDQLRVLCDDFPAEQLIYIHTGDNLGFGKGHNVAMKAAMEKGFVYHAVVNPDIYFDDDILQSLAAFMDSHPDVGLCMPKILNPDGTMQALCKQLPRPFDLIFRRFLPGFLKPLFRKRMEWFEMKNADFENNLDVPYLSGCFMFLRLGVLKEIGLFDERYFMYLEDTDLSRRIGEHHRTVYFPKAQAYHLHAKGSYRNWRLLKIHIKSAISYFNKWGWWPLI